MSRASGEADFELHRLVQLGDIASVKELLEAQYERRSKGKPLFLSFTEWLFWISDSGGWIGKGKELSGDLRKMDVNGYNRGGKIPLHLAAAKGNRNMAKLLLDNGTIVDLPDSQGESALLIAAYHGHEGVVRLLLDYKGLT